MFPVGHLYSSGPFASAKTLEQKLKIELFCLVSDSETLTPLCLPYQGKVGLNQ